MSPTLLARSGSVQGGALPVRQGDEVVLIGRQGEAFLSAEEAARRTGTINYDVVSRIMARVPRIVMEKGMPT